MEQFALFLVLKALLISIDTSYSYHFNDMDANRPFECGVYIKGGEPSAYRSVSNQHYYNNIARVQILLQGDNSKDGLLSLLDLVSKIKEALILTSNSYYNIPADNYETFKNKKLMIISSKLMGDVNFEGRNDQELPRYSINLKFTYNIK